MATGRDLRDMLGLPAGCDGPKAVQKRPKAAVPARKIQGVAREVAALYGERPPPVAVYEEKKAYRAKRQSTGPVKKWVSQPFINPARSDGLVLKHWRRKPGPAAGEDAAMTDGEPEQPYIETCNDYAKYDIKVDMPDFTDEEYDAHLHSDDWSREETDYLFGIVKDYAYRWAVIWDRYEWQALKAREREEQAEKGKQEGEDASQVMATLPFAPPRDKERSLEEMKARFYDISAKLMKLRIPEVQMDAEQYSLYETLAKFDPALEKNRKMLATALMNRSMDEVKEEEFLLTELQRINMAANRLDAERDELRARLDAPQPNAAPAGVQAFTSSTALQALFQQLFQQDRSKKRASGAASGPGRLSLSANDMINTPGQQQQLTAAARRQSMAQPPAAPPPVKHLSPLQETRFAVSTHERLTSGVTFGSDKLLKMRQAKSNVQTQKIAGALAELGVSDIIAIPTSRVGDVFEQLVQRVGKLLDLRKVREKEQGEVRVLTAMKNAAAAGSSGPGSGSGSNAETAKGKAKAAPAASTAATTTATTAPATDSKTEQSSASASASATPAAQPSEIAETPKDTPASGGDGDGDDNGDGNGSGGDVADADADPDADAEGEDESRAASQAGRKRSASTFSQESGREKRARK